MRLDTTVNLYSAEALEGMPEVSEDGATFEENAAIKALAIQPLIPRGAWVLADDSGLEVPALDGAPGVRSARYAGAGATDAANNLKLLHELEGIPDADRTARFVCVLLLRSSTDEIHRFTGICHGRILESPRGTGGFGYDPLFQPEGLESSFAELPPGEKNRISHRAKAVDRLARWVSLQV